MSKPTKDEVLEFLKDPESVEKLLELVASIASDSMAEPEENDLPLSPGNWIVGHAYTESVFSDIRGTGTIADCKGTNAEADAVAIAALKELLRACKAWLDWLHFAPEAMNGFQRGIYDAVIAAGINMETNDV